MDKILQYFNDNPKLIIVSVIALVVCLIVAVVIIVCKKAVNKKRATTKQVENSSSAPCDDVDSTIDTKVIEENETTEIDEEKSESVDSTLVEETTADNDADVEQAVTDEKGEENLEEKEEIKTEEKAKKEEVKAEEITKEKSKKALNNTVNNDVKPKADTRYAGKWVIIVENNRYSAELRASNAEILLRTESYTALSGIKSGIETVKNNIEKNNISISMDKNGNFFFKVYSSSTRLLCVSEGYATKVACERAVESARRFSKTAIVVREEKAEE